MEEAAELGNYLPLSYKSPKQQEYIAFLAYHMLMRTPRSACGLTLPAWRVTRSTRACVGCTMP